MPALEGRWATGEVKTLTLALACGEGKGMVVWTRHLPKAFLSSLNGLIGAVDGEGGGGDGEAEDIDEDNHEPDAVEGLRAVVDLGLLIAS